MDKAGVAVALATISVVFAAVVFAAVELRSRIVANSTAGVKAS
jgi:hypothetical protein